jgi:hypothetical protein
MVVISELKHCDWKDVKILQQAKLNAHNGKREK